MIVNEWVETVWNVIQIRPKTLHDYKRLYKRHLMPVIGYMPVDNVDVVALQQKLLSLPPQDGYTFGYLFALALHFYEKGLPATITAIKAELAAGEKDKPVLKLNEVKEIGKS